MQHVSMQHVSMQHVSYILYLVLCVAFAKCLTFSCSFSLFLHWYLFKLKLLQTEKKTEAEKIGASLISSTCLVKTLLSATGFSNFLQTRITFLLNPDISNGDHKFYCTIILFCPSTVCVTKMTPAGTLQNRSKSIDGTLKKKRVKQLG